VSEPILSVNGLTAGYGDIVVIRDVSFDVPAGRITALLGRNGAGKTTTMRVISGLIRPKRGTVILRGEDVTTVPPYKRVSRRIAYVQEGKRIFRFRTVEENLMLGAYSRRVSRRDLQEDFDLAYERFPALRDRRGTPAAVLSGGQQQMLAIAQALIARPDVLLLDEPSAGLAPALVQEVFASIAQLRTDGLSVLLVEQAVDAALSIADEVVVLDLGRVVHQGGRRDPGLESVIESAYFGGAQRQAS
jgi:branched-chain amino acid transport system ATP-binding protein